MTNQTVPMPILMADDDPDDRLMAREAIAESRLLNPVMFVEDGEELMDYLYHRGRYEKELSPRPGLILLDLNMPRKAGQEALREIKEDPDLRRIPVVVLTTSRTEIDILQTYDLGASSFIIKPVSFDGMVEAIQTVGEYWFRIVSLPSTT